MSTTDATTGGQPAPTSRLWTRLYNGETSYDFAGRWKLWFLLSGAVIAIGLISLGSRGLDLGIDFTGGTVWEVPAKGVSVPEARDAVDGFGLGEVKVQLVDGDTVRVTGPKDTTAAKRDQVTTALAKLGNTSVDQVDVTFVGPSWGQDVTKKAQRSLVVFFILIAAYISLRFEWKMAAAALLAVVHDILVTVGVYSVSGFSVTPATVIAFLTILGYSLYDTIVVFDKVEENVKSAGGSGRMTYTDIVNLSMNQTLMRSLNTSFVAILPILSLLVFGAGVMGATALGDFGLALFIGLLTGAYSSIFIASPVLAMVKEREPRYTQIRARLQGRTGAITPAMAAAGRAVAGGASPAEAERMLRPSGAGNAPGVPGGGSGAAGTSRPVNRPAPRPRKQGKKR